MDQKDVTVAQIRARHADKLGDVQRRKAKLNEEIARLNAQLARINDSQLKAEEALAALENASGSDLSSKEYAARRAIDKMASTY